MILANLILIIEKTNPIGGDDGQVDQSDIDLIKKFMGEVIKKMGRFSKNSAKYCELNKSLDSLENAAPATLGDLRSIIEYFIAVTKMTRKGPSTFWIERAESSSHRACVTALESVEYSQIKNILSSQKNDITPTAS